ncbi:MAG: transcriptional regulator [Pseudomonadota bacterium]
METHAKLRVDILIEAPLRARLAALLDEHDVSGYTVFAALGGRGIEGDWSRNGQITDIGQMLLFTCILDQSRCDSLLDALYDDFSSHIGYVTTSNVDVIRRDKFP